MSTLWFVLRVGLALKRKTQPGAVPSARWYCIAPVASTAGVGSRASGPGSLTRRLSCHPYSVSLCNLCKCVPFIRVACPCCNKYYSHVT